MQKVSPGMEPGTFWLLEWSLRPLSYVGWCWKGNWNLCFWIKVILDWFYFVSTSPTYRDHCATFLSSFLLFYNILSDCHNSDTIDYLLNAFRLKKKKLDLVFSSRYRNLVSAANPFISCLLVKTPQPISEYFVETKICCTIPHFTLTT